MQLKHLQILRTASKYINQIKTNANIKNMSDASATPDQRNVEIKARIPGGVEEFERRLDVAKKLSGVGGELIVQRDVFLIHLRAVA